MRILIAEYALAAGLGGTWELEGKAMLSALVGSFERCGHEAIYPTHGPEIDRGRPVHVRSDGEFEALLGAEEVDAALVIAPDDILPRFLEIVEENEANLGTGPEAARLCADKLRCTEALERAGVPVAEVVKGGALPVMGCSQYVIKPRTGCGSEGVRISSSPVAEEGCIATRYVEGLHLSVSFVACGDRFLPLTVNRQIIESDGLGFAYAGSQVPYRSPREDEILKVAKEACRALDLKGYAGVDLVLGDRPRVVDVNARPTTSLIGITRVMHEEIADLILRARFGWLPDKVNVEGEVTFRKGDLG